MKVGCMRQSRDVVALIGRNINCSIMIEIPRASLKTSLTRQTGKGQRDI